MFVTVLDYALSKVNSGKEEELSLTLMPSRSRRIPVESLYDLDFADDFVLMSNKVKLAHKLLINVERECKGVGLRLNSSKTKAMYIKTEVENLKDKDSEDIGQAITQSGD